MKMNNTSNAKKIATLSIVLSITINCLLKFGRNLTSFNILKRRKVRKTERPLPAEPLPKYVSNTSYMLKKIHCASVSINYLI